LSGVKQKIGGIQQKRVICAADKTTDRQREHMLGWVGTHSYEQK
jgi:hypothetical protein